MCNVFVTIRSSGKLNFASSPFPPGQSSFSQTARARVDLFFRPNRGRPEPRPSCYRANFFWCEIRLIFGRVQLLGAPRLIQKSNIRKPTWHQRLFAGRHQRLALFSDVWDKRTPRERTAPAFGQTANSLKQSPTMNRARAICFSRATRTISSLISTPAPHMNAGSTCASHQARAAALRPITPCPAQKSRPRFDDPADLSQEPGIGIVLVEGGTRGPRAHGPRSSPSHPSARRWLPTADPRRFLACRGTRWPGSPAHKPDLPLFKASYVATSFIVPRIVAPVPAFRRSDPGA